MKLKDLPMKFTKIILVVLIASSLQSCFPPAAARLLTLPSQLISTVTGPILGGLL